MIQSTIAQGDEEFALINYLVVHSTLRLSCQLLKGARTTFSPSPVYVLRCLAALCTLWSTQYLLFDVADET